MGWSIGYSDGRDIGYGVPAECDHPKCHEKIDRGLSYVCAGEQPYGGETGCGMFFCSKHLIYGRPGGPHCPRCVNYKPPYKHRKPDIPEWLNWKLTDETSVRVRLSNRPEQTRVLSMLARLSFSLLRRLPLLLVKSQPHGSYKNRGATWTKMRSGAYMSGRDLWRGLGKY